MTYGFFADHIKTKQHNTSQYLASVRSWHYFDRPKTCHSMTRTLNLNHPKTSDHYWAWDWNSYQPRDLHTTTLPEPNSVLRYNYYLKITMPERKAIMTKNLTLKLQPLYLDATMVANNKLNPQMNQKIWYNNWAFISEEIWKTQPPSTSLFSTMLDTQPGGFTYCETW